MFAIFGLGCGELVVIGIIAVLIFAVPLIVIVGVLRKSAPAQHRRDELADLREQIAELRDEVKRLKKELGKSASPDGIIADGPN